ncbi:MAG: hypothetical protein RLY31_2167 [Bacteroidota bacterium]|jgi:branched-subunit amino acid aminotransferase/4-amino-4-deoxychorismate lyase
MIAYYSVNGELLPVEAAKLQVNDLSILRGYGLFDFFLARRGRPLFFDDYLDRFLRSAGLLHLPVPYTRSELKRMVLDVLDANGQADAGLKLVLTGGYSPDGYTPGSTPNLVILQSPLPVYPAQHYAEGVKLMGYAYHRTLAAAKTINYIMGVYLIPEMRAAGAEDVLFHAGGQVYETTRANFFIVTADGTVVTPGAGVLEGITRRKTLDIARQRHPVAERSLLLSELPAAAEAFLTSSTKQIMPVTSVDDVIIGDGMPGPVTRDLMAALDLEIERYLSMPAGAGA